MSDFNQVSLQKQLAAIARGRLSVTELAVTHLRQIQRLQDTLHAFTHVRPREVLANARRADAVRPNQRGPLHGALVSIKDNIDEKGKPTTAGTRIWARRIAEQDATIVRRLLNDGALSIGRTNLHEFAAGMTTANADFGIARNPWDISRIPGGSSGGAAIAVATGCCAAAIGTDTGGSVRIPAALCGVVGLKPTYGSISRRGIVPLAWSLDHVGVMARSVGDVALILKSVVGYDPGDLASRKEETTRFGSYRRKSIEGLRVGVDAQLLKGVDRSVERALHRSVDALCKHGMRRVKITLLYLEEALAAQYLIGRAESAAAHAHLLGRQGARIGPDVRARFEAGLRVSAVDYLQALRVRSAFVNSVSEVFRRCDVLVLPAGPRAAPPHGATTAMVAGKRVRLRDLYMRFNAPFNLAGNPAIAVPTGLDPTGLPLSVQIAGPAFGEQRLLAVAGKLEASLAQTPMPPLAESANA